MKVFFACLLLASSARAANVVTNPAATQTIVPTAASVVSVKIDNTGTASSGELGLYVVTQGSSANANGAIRGESTDWDAIAGVSVEGAGLYGYSDNFVGVYGGSANGSAGYFQSNSGLNNSPTLVVQAIGGNADLMQIQNSGGSALVKADKDGQVFVSKGLALSTSGTKPTCASGIRGMLWVVQGAAGVADVLQACLKDAANNYSWVNK